MGAALVALAVVGAPAALAAPPPTESPILIRSLAPALGGDADAEYAMLQMTVDGQGDVDGSELRFYGPSGAQTGLYELEGGSLVGEAQRMIFLATADAVTAGAPAPDFALDTGDALAAAGGALCISGPYPADCVTWGSFPKASGSGLPDPQGQNADEIRANALGRSAANGCATWLDPDDDNRPSAAHFFDGVHPPGTPTNPPPPPEPGPPSPRNNAAGKAPGTTPCALTTAFNGTPRNPTNDTTPSFWLGTVPPEYGTEYSCRFAPHPIGPEAGTPFAPCDETTGYGPLADGSYDFEAFASGEAGPDSTPIEWTFEVDTVPPQTTIVSTPGPVSNGFSASFSFAASEEHPTFRCQLDSGPNQTCEPGKTYYFLADGPHTFRVWGSDQATNQDPTPATHTFVVDSAFGDTAPPFTQLTAAPPKHSKVASARFAYSANESRARFECRVDDDPFAACDAGGVFYPGLRNGRHVFEVRAVDRAGNADPTPEAHAWTIDGPVPETTILRAPPGVRRTAKAALRVSFAFRSSQARSRFACRLDGRAFKSCMSPLRLRVRPGRHSFEVYAIDPLGNLDPSPARRIFRVLERGGESVFGGGGR